MLGYWLPCAPVSDVKDGSHSSRVPSIMGTIRSIPPPKWTVQRATRQTLAWRGGERGIGRQQPLEPLHGHRSSFSALLHSCTSIFGTSCKIKPAEFCVVPALIPREKHVHGRFVADAAFPSRVFDVERTGFLRLLSETPPPRPPGFPDSVRLTCRVSQHTSVLSYYFSTNPKASRKEALCPLDSFACYSSPPSISNSQSISSSSPIPNSPIKELEVDSCTRLSIADISS